jgi:hypothetical protein
VHKKFWSEANADNARTHISHNHIKADCSITSNILKISVRWTTQYVETETRQNVKVKEDQSGPPEESKTRVQRIVTY